MKFFIFIFIFISVSANELSWVDEQVEAIKPPRVGIDNLVINKTKDPFIFLKKNGAKAQKKKIVKTNKKKKSKKVYQVSKKTISKLTIDMIINSSARVNSKWYKTGEIVSGYKILKIKKQSIIVTFNGKKSQFFIQQQKSNLKLKKK